MSSYVVLARKWRPTQFADIVGQGAVVRTLMNAIRSNRIHQAYLLTGSRGIGKTSIARIFAKAVRCEKLNLESGDSQVRSCDDCPSCREIAGSNSVDVIEIDGASNNGVDAVREIRENAKFLPAVGKRKIYIIDEVHMLTTAAFNALLKTLEEPPPHVIFIFATTEPHKIPATILSRCQRFDLKRVTVAQIQARLLEVTQKEVIDAESGALALIARAAEGSMRDALSLLDQVVAFSAGKVTAPSVRESIGLIEGQTLSGILKGILGRKPLEALPWVDQAYQNGHDLRVLTRGLIDFLHGVILAQVGASCPPTLELSGEEWKDLQSLATLRPLEELELIFQIFHHGVDSIARSPQPKIVLDILIIKSATAEMLVPVSEISVSTAKSGSGAGPSGQPKASSLNPSLGEKLAAPTGAQTGVQSQPLQAQLTWEGFIAHVRQTRPLLASILEHGSCDQMQSEDQVLTINFGSEDAYFCEQLQSRVYSEQLGLLSKEYLRRSVRLQIEQRESTADSVESVAARKERELREKQGAARLAVQNHPIIREAKSLFGAELGPIELTESVGEMAKNA